jgi:glycosyltransferase involved in cell wall biosynthesis
MGLRVCLVTLYDQPDFYPLDSRVIRVHLGSKSAFLVLRVLALPLFAADKLIQAIFPALPPTAIKRGKRASTIVRAATRVLTSSGALRALEWGIRIHPLTMFRILALRSTIRKLRPSVVGGFCGSTNLITVFACRRTACRVVISERNDPKRQILPFPWNHLRPRIYAEADLVTANSRGSLEALRDWVSPEKLQFIPNPLAIPKSGRGAEPPPGLERPRLLIVGRLCKQKAHSVLFSAMALLPPELSEWCLSVVGRGPEEEPLRRLAEQLGIAARVQWHGQVENPDPFYRCADIFVLPSLHEGMPNALLEAMNQGLPSIVSDASPGPLEVVKDGVTGLVVPVGDPQALANAIALLASQPDLRRHLGESARKQVAGYKLDRALVVWEQALGLSTTSGKTLSCSSQSSAPVEEPIETTMGNHP